ncbi:PepSY domain-containing protein [Sphaerisporangium rubeum]|uniref:Putative iron-regulated membrane protein n=1 Tax=Sphaerisporangium rubeum TaxID=321317 RepID=A0A7X0IAZ5_9ACTN|nr:PepSY domain-containing protein [Sphaerisporangium rubeum]MBB6471743.1 putative iron-regulated membrane protein [Sphaerisporangium rubeum]
MTSVGVRPESGPVTPAPKGASRRYRVVWRWHFYAGLFVAPILVVLAVTGSIYLFKEPFEEWRYQDVRTLAAPVTAARPLAEQIAAAQRTHPGAGVLSVIPPSAPDRTTRVILMGTESGPFAQGISVYVDPGSLRVLGEIDDSATFMRVVRTVHGELLAGKAGDRIVETAACWALILAATGAYMWWRGPARRRAPRRGRPRLRRVHALTGVGAGAVVVFLIISGLPWSGVWGDAFQRLQDTTGSTSPSADAFPHTSTVPALSGDLSAEPDAKVPWAAELLPVPSSGDPGHGAHGPAAGVLQPGAIPVERALSSARPVLRDCRPADCEVKVLLPKDKEGVYTVVAAPRADPSASRTVHVDQYSGQVLVSFGWQEYGLLAKAVEQGIALHEGRRYGVVNLLVMLGACLALLTLVVTGVWMWWKRRPDGRAGAPARTGDRRTTWGVAAIMAVLGVLFPLAGLTMVAVLLLDRLVIRRVPALRRIF